MIYNDEKYRQHFRRNMLFRKSRAEDGANILLNIMDLILN